MNKDLSGRRKWESRYVSEAIRDAARAIRVIQGKSQRVVMRVGPAVIFISLSYMPLKVGYGACRQAEKRHDHDEIPHYQFVNISRLRSCNVPI